MTRLTATLSLIAGALLSGCSSPPPNQGNPFDEARRSQPTSPARYAAPLQLKPIDVPNSPPESPLQAVAQAFPTATTLPVEGGPSQSEAKAQTNSSQLALVEARRVGGQGDISTMVELMEQSAYMGNDQALYELARIFHNGVGVPKDINRAIGYLTTADGRGHLEATRVLAWDYLQGNGVQADSHYAEQLFQKAAAGSLRAKREYGVLLAGLVQPGFNDLDRGITLLSEASAAGDSEATYRLSQALDRKGDTTGAAKARAEAGSLGVQQLVPDKPKLTVQGVKAEVKAEALKTQALGGDRQAMYDLALGLMLRKYPAIDGEFEAYCWLAVAKDLGHAGAAQELQAIQGVRVATDAVSPGKMDRCIADLHEAIPR